MRSLILLALLVVSCTAVVIPARFNVAECVMCKIAVRVAAPSLGKDSLKIEQDFDKECKKELKVPEESKMCEKYINDQLDPIVHELESGTAPKDVCTKLHDC